MTIDELILALQRARETLPSRGSAAVRMADGVLVVRIDADHELDGVRVVTWESSRPEGRVTG